MKREREHASDDDEDVNVFKQECKAEVSTQIAIQFKFVTIN